MWQVVRCLFMPGRSAKASFSTPGLVRNTGSGCPAVCPSVRRWSRNQPMFERQSPESPEWLGSNSSPKPLHLGANPKKPRKWLGHQKEFSSTVSSVSCDPLYQLPILLSTLSGMGKFDPNWTLMENGLPFFSPFVFQALYPNPTGV